MRDMKKYIHENPNWTSFYWNHEEVTPLLAHARNIQGRLIGKMEALGFDLQDEALVQTLTTEIVKSSEIEGEILDFGQVRSSIAKRLGISVIGMVDSERYVEGIVEMMLDATLNKDLDLTKDRLCCWHSILFPTGRSNMQKIVVGDWRNDHSGPMQVISGSIGKEIVHFQAPKATRLQEEMEQYLIWFNNENRLDLVLKAAIAHFWFITIHPFEDGNGRIARTLTEMMLARSDQSSKRFYSMSAQIRKERNSYYNILESSQSGTSNITPWIIWFLECLKESIQHSEILLSKVLQKDAFWKRHTLTPINDRQIKIINALLDGFEGHLTTTKWAKINKCSTDTALRDIQDLIHKNIVEKTESGGRSTSYLLANYL
jgi:Fic family protein